MRTDIINTLRNELAAERQRALRAEATAHGLQQQLAELRAKPQQQPEPTPREKFFADAQQRLSGLAGEAREAEFAKFETEIERIVDAEAQACVAANEKMIAQMGATIKRATLENAALEILADIAKPGATDLLKPYIVKRLACERVGDGWPVTVLDTDGKPLASSIDDLKDELRHTPALSAFIKGADQTEQAAHARRVAAVLGTQH